MESYTHLYTLLVLGLFVIAHVSEVQAQTTYKCNGHEFKLSDEDVARLKECGELVGVKTMEEMTAEKLPCFAKCVLEKYGLVDDQGKPHKESILNGIDKNVEDAVKEEYKKAVGTCIDEHGDHISPKDETCLSYAPLAMCATTAFKSICHG